MSDDCIADDASFRAFAKQELVKEGHPDHSAEVILKNIEECGLSVYDHYLLYAPAFVELFWKRRDNV